MTYQEALEWFTVSWSLALNQGLERMAWMLEELGNPQDNLKAGISLGLMEKGLR